MVTAGGCPVLLGYCWRLSCLVSAVLSFFSKIPWSVLSYLAELVGVVFTCNLLDGAKCSILGLDRLDVGERGYQ